MSEQKPTEIDPRGPQLNAALTSVVLAATLLATLLESLLFGVAPRDTSTISGAALDCYSEEPLPLDHPLRRAPNTLLVPHAGWMTREARARMLSEPVDNILAWLAGRPQNLVGSGL